MLIYYVLRLRTHKQGRGQQMLFDLNDEHSIKVVGDFLSGVRSAGKSIGLTSGRFDLIHFYHFSFFLRCHRSCDILIVGVDVDEMVRADKGPSRPIIPDFQRVIMVDALRPVSFSFIMNNVQDFGRAAEILQPDIIFKNQDFEGKEDTILGHEHAQRIVILRDQLSHHSTTDIIREASKESGRPSSG